MIPEEFNARNHVRTANGLRSCTGDEPCMHAACDEVGRWYCRLTLTTRGDRLSLGPRPERVTCDKHAIYTPGPNPGPLSELGERFRAYT